MHIRERKMEPRVIVTIAIAILSVGGTIGVVVFFFKDKIKTANVFGWIGFVSSIGLIVMGAIIHHWWVWVPAIILVIVSGFFLLANNCDDGPYPSPSYYDE